MRCSPRVAESVRRSGFREKYNNIISRPSFVVVYFLNFATCPWLFEGSARHGKDSTARCHLVARWQFARHIHEQVLRVNGFWLYICFCDWWMKTDESLSDGDNNFRKRKCEQNNRLFIDCCLLKGRGDFVGWWLQGYQSSSARCVAKSLFRTAIIAILM